MPKIAHLLIAALLLAHLAWVAPATATVYEVGPGRDLEAIGDVPWQSLVPGDHIRIHWRVEAYREKWVIGRRGSAEAPIVVEG
ncbi:MAG: polysaccharide-degrading enzyme, partial [bacterium]|nr:polysaccharide-degrading enzyme [bacterium]